MPFAVILFELISSLFKVEFVPNAEDIYSIPSSKISLLAKTNSCSVSFFANASPRKEAPLIPI